MSASFEKIQQGRALVGPKTCIFPISGPFDSAYNSNHTCILELKYAKLRNYLNYIITHVMPQFCTDIAQNVEAGARQYLFRNQRSSRKMCSFPISRALDTAIYPPHNAGNIEAAQKNARMCRVQPRLYAQSINRAFCLHGSLERGSDAHIQLVRSSL